MTEQEQKTILANNLRKLLNDSGKTQREVSDAIGVTPQVLNSWTQAKSLPGIWKIQALADYFGVPKSHLLDNQPNSSYALEDARAVHIVRTDALLREAIKVYATLPDEKKRYVIDLIHMLAEGAHDD